MKQYKNPKTEAYLKKYKELRQRGYNADVARRIAWMRTLGTEELKTVSEVPKEELVDGVVENIGEFETVEEVPE